MNAAIRFFFEIRAPIADVFCALATNEGLAGWWTRTLDGSHHIGERITLRFDDLEVVLKLLQMKQDEAVLWEVLSAGEEWNGTRINFQLASMNDQTTLVRFGHVGWRRESDHYASCSYQWAEYMFSLRDYCEKRGGSPFQEHERQNLARSTHVR
ncbi:MAG: SRPBCC domain-containing protein [Planctomycetes bacterium]|nr:SRPBCC domain-containing protein [Planctomycetota bacterium]